MSATILHAPVAGWLSSLDEVPDPVFAERMMGDGFAIDPLEGVLRAPCDAEIVSIPETAHAVTLALAGGAQLLIHVGLETVALGGAGFTARAAAGQRVQTGDVLIEFDLDAVAAQAKSLITPIVLVSEDFALTPGVLDRPVTTGDPIGEIRPMSEATAPAPSPQGGEDEQARHAPGVASDCRGQSEPAHGEGARRQKDYPESRTSPPNPPLPGGGKKAETVHHASRDAIVGATHGIHARPAARIAAAAKRSGAVVRIESAAGRASARSPVGLMALGLRHGEQVRIVAEGPGAEAAITAIAALVAATEPAGPPVPTTAPPAVTGDRRLQGVCASPGLAIGPAAHLRLAEMSVPEQGQGEEAEGEALRAALRSAADRLDRSGNDIAAAHQALIEDEQLRAAAEAQIAAGRSAGFAWRAALRASEAALRATGNSLLIERIDDLRDVERQVLAELLGCGAAPNADFPEGAVLIADLLLPSRMMSLDLTRIAAIVTARGGPTSHAALLAAAAGVPMVVALGEAVLALEEGTTLIVEAGRGSVEAAPPADALARAAARVEQHRRRRAAEAEAAAQDCRMADGTRIEIFANLASPEEARIAVAAGAEGCGLLRTEFLFHDRPSPPDEEEQARAYAAVAGALQGRPLIVRTLDIGADKPAPFLALPAEENPALGVRGIRLGLARPDLLSVQLRAILAASVGADIRVMVPMIVDVDELRAVRAMLEGAAAEMAVAVPPLGVMVETPAAALLADSLAAEAEFLSVGTNDLSQYALAADRGNPGTASRLDALHPAVLRLVGLAGEAARRRGRWFGVCGGVASDPLAAAILIGLGANELSATPAAIPALKAAVRTLTLEGCRVLAAEAQRLSTASEVRALAARAAAPAMQGAA